MSLCVCLCVCSGRVGMDGGARGGSGPWWVVAVHYLFNSWPRDRTRLLGYDESESEQQRFVCSPFPARDYSVSLPSEAYLLIYI